MRDTRLRPILILALTLGSVAAAPATAAQIPVLGPSGMTVRSDPGVAARDTSTVGLPPAPARPRVAGHARRTATPLRLLQTFRDRGQLDPASYAAARSAYTRARSLGRRLSGRRGSELRGVVAVVDGIAARGSFTVSRVPVLTLTLQRNAQWWGGDGALLASGARVSFEGSQLVWQSVPGQGLQFHPLANFGKLNALFKDRLGRTRMTALLDELLPLRAQRAGGTAWEYYYTFDGGRGPWTSSLSQGAGVQATARAATRALRTDLLPELEAGLAIFKTAPPEGVRVPFPGGGVHYAQYSFWPELRIANGFAQSLVGLYDYAQITGSPTALSLFEDGMTSARRDLPTFDTGAWSLYSQGAISRESDAHYHGVLIEFAGNLCDRTADAGVCAFVQRLEAEKATPPTLALVTRTLRAGTPGRVRVKLSKISRVRLQLRRGGKLVYDSSSTVGYGTRSWAVTPPRSTRGYDVSVSATDLEGNAAEPVAGSIEVLPPRSRK